MNQYKMALIVFGDSINEIKNGVTAAYGQFNPGAAVTHAPINTLTPEEAALRNIGNDDDEETTVPANIPLVPTPPSIPEAPAAPVTQVVTGELDIRGIPWDADIHGEKRNKNNDGTWRNKKGVDKELLVKKESYYLSLRQLPTGAPQVAAPAIPAPTPTINVAPTPIPPGPALPNPVAAPIAAPTPVPLPPPPPTNIYAVDINGFKTNLGLICSGLIDKGTFNSEYVESLCTNMGVSNILDILKDEVKTKQLYDFFAQYGWITAC